MYFSIGNEIDRLKSAVKQTNKIVIIINDQINRGFLNIINIFYKMRGKELYVFQNQRLSQNYFSQDNNNIKVEDKKAKMAHWPLAQGAKAKRFITNPLESTLSVGLD